LYSYLYISIRVLFLFTLLFTRWFRLYVFIYTTLPGGMRAIMFNLYYSCITSFNNLFSTQYQVYNAYIQLKKSPIIKKLSTLLWDSTLYQTISIIEYIKLYHSSLFNQVDTFFYHPFSGLFYKNKPTNQPKTCLVCYLF